MFYKSNCVVCYGLSAHENMEINCVAKSQTLQHILILPLIHEAKTSGNLNRMKCFSFQSQCLFPLQRIFLMCLRQKKKMIKHFLNCEEQLAV